MLDFLRKFLQKLCLIFGIAFFYGQELPPIQYYSPDDYFGENQNWGISQSSQKFIYVANNKGLLEFNGASWNIYPSPNQTLIRSVKCIEQRIYTGCYMEFGYWEQNNSNKLVYTSLSKTLDVELIEDEQFWQIYQVEEFLAFCSLNRIYFYDVEKEIFQIFNPSSAILKTFKVGSTLYFQDTNNNIFRFFEGKAELIIGKSQIEEAVVINIIESDSGLLLISDTNGYFKYDGRATKKYDFPSNSEFRNSTIYSAIPLFKDKIAIGTISNGVFIIDKNFTIENHITQINGLGNNTVLSMFQDLDQNLWLGLDNGINIINLESPFRVFDDLTGQLGTVYASLVSQGNLYLGTNQGLFYRPLKDRESFTFIEGTKGQVWSIREYENTILCGHNSGTYLIQNNNAKLVIDEPGAWDIKPLGPPNLYLQGNYSGLFVVSFENSQWQLKHKVGDFNISSRTFEVLDHSIFVNHEYKGIFKLNVDDDFKEIISTDNLTFTGRRSHSGLTKVNDSILYFNEEGVFNYNNEENTFFKNAQLSNQFRSGNYTSGNIIRDTINQRLWAFSGETIKFLQPGSISQSKNYIEIPVSSNLRKEFVGFENLTLLYDDIYLMGTSKGYITFDLDKFETVDDEIYLNEVAVYDTNDRLVGSGPENNQQFESKENNLEFKYSIPNFNKFISAEYRYKLNGYRDNWSRWSKRSSVSFKNLPFGDYKFEVEGRVGDHVIKPIKSYQFRIARPWFISNYMLALYLLFIAVFSIVMHLFYKKYYQKRQQKIMLRKEKELQFQQMQYEKQRMEFENERLQKDVDSKSRELAISTMSLIKKNEFLNELKTEIGKLTTSEEISKLERIVDSKLNNDDDWQMFEEAFTNADQDFFKKLKEQHPNLTPNDLRLCAYLRLNLTSKEISPLLNITYRSVEIKRYRLRKKLDLSHEMSLADYILSI